MACNSDKGLPCGTLHLRLRSYLQKTALVCLKASMLILSGSVTDPNHNPDELTVTWYVGSEVVCEASTPYGQGDTDCAVVLEPEDTEID